MSIFDSPHKKWINKHENTVWNRIFTGFDEYDTMITKLMVYECVSFSDNLLSSEMFSGENIALRTDTILLAKMHFYHLVTKSPLVHNMFYGYIHELWENHYQKDLETINISLDRMRSTEKWYLTWYYNYYEDKTGSFVPVINEYCKNVKRNKTSDGAPILNCEIEELHKYAANLLMDMHLSFMEEVK